MLYIFGKPILGHLCFKYLKMIFSINHALKTGFSKGLIFEDLRISGCGKNVHIFKIQIARLVLIVEKRYAYRWNCHKLYFLEI